MLEHAVYISVFRNGVRTSTQRTPKLCCNPVSPRCKTVLSFAVRINRSHVHRLVPKHVVLAVERKVSLLWQQLAAPLVVPDAVVIWIILLFCIGFCW